MENSTQPFLMFFLNPSILSLLFLKLCMAKHFLGKSVEIHLHEGTD